MKSLGFRRVNAFCNIRKNGTNVVEAYTGPGGKRLFFSRTSNSVMMSLLHGDKVDPGACSRITSLYGNADHTSF